MQRQQEQDFAVLLPALQGLSEAQGRLFFLTASVIARFRPEGFEKMLDDDVAEAAAALAATFETAQRGVIYEHRPGSLVAQRLGAELKTVYTEVGGNGGSRFERDAAAALRAMEKGARPGKQERAETAYVELLKRLAGPDAESARGVKTGGGGIIIPGAT